MPIRMALRILKSGKFGRTRTKRLNLAYEAIQKARQGRWGANQRIDIT